MHDSTKRDSYAAVHVGEAFGLRFSFGVGASPEEAMRRARSHTECSPEEFDIVTVNHETAAAIEMRRLPLIVDEGEGTARLAERGGLVFRVRPEDLNPPGYRASSGSYCSAP